MRSDEFLTALTRAMPGRDELEAYGLESGEIDEVQSSFKFVRRDASAVGSGAGSELERMITEYDCSTVEVGLLQFLDGPRDHPCGRQVAFCEADPLIVKADGSVVLCDHADPNTVIIECGVDPERFLDALAAFLEIRRDKSKWKGRAVEAAELCAKNAGGAEYVQFYRLLCEFPG